MKSSTEHTGQAPTTQPGEQRVLIFPALAEPLHGRKLSFLYSVYQLEDLLLDTAIQPVPYAPPHVLGVTEWREQVLPVIAMEKCLGLTGQSTHAATRFLVIKSVRREAEGEVVENYGMLRVARQIQMHNLPISCRPAPRELVPMEHLVRQVYEWEQGYLIVTKIQAILDGFLQAGDRHV